MSLVDEVTVEIKRMSTISIVKHFFEHWLEFRDFVTDDLSDADLEKLLVSISRVTSYINCEVDGDAE